MINFSQDLFRPMPRQGVAAYQSYAIRAVPGVHTRVLTCKEANCPAYERGWVTRVDVATELGRRQAGYIERTSGRKYRRTEQGTMYSYLFGPGQTCFAEHREQFKPGLYLKRDGDWRGNPTGRKQMMSERSWVDDFGEHQEKLIELQKRG